MKKNIKFLNGLLFLIMFIVFNILQVNAAHVAGSGGGARRINLGEKYGELEAFSVYQDIVNKAFNALKK
ncbi:MAG: hypothetical protein WBH68_08455 [Erysipelotrichaceae bacterium]